MISFLMIYFLIWWILLFVSLPICIKEKETNTKKIYKKEITKIYLLPKLLIITITSLPLAYFFNEYLKEMIIEFLK